MKIKKIFLMLVLMLTLATLASCSFVSSLLPQPKSAYDIAVENGFQGSEAEWLASIKGESGNDGKDGNDGNNGSDGKSAYELYCDLFGYEGNEEQWLIDLRTGALISFEVTFNLNGGEAPEGFISSATVRGGSFLDLKTPARDGYTFVGWWTGDSNIDFAMSETIAVRSDLTLTAKWRKDVMSVRFLDKDGKLLKQETVSYGGAATAPEAPEVAEFMFQKWDVDFSVVTEDLIVKAVYSPLYKLSFNTDGGTTIADATYLPEDVPTAPINPQKGDLVFRGWYADAEFSVPYDFSTPLTQNTTIYAYFSDLKPISTAEELRAIGDNSTGKFYLTNDINLGGEVWTPLNGFAGEFDGRGYKIHDFVISETQSAGFFTANSGTIQNLTLSDFAFSVASVSTTFNAGALVGTNEGTVENCHITDAVLTYHSYPTGQQAAQYESFAGGIVGSNTGTVSNCSVYANISCCADLYMNVYDSLSAHNTLWFGGAIGTNSGTVTNVTANTVVEGIAQGDVPGDDGAFVYLQMGGLVATNYGEILLSDSHIEVTAVCETTSADLEGRGYTQARIHFGGFAYLNAGEVFECSASGVYDASNASVWGDIAIGGFVVVNEQQITDCYTNVMLKSAKAIANTQNTNIAGGFVGKNSGVITSSYTAANMEMQTVGYFGGFVGVNESSGLISKCFATANITYTDTSLGVGCFAGKVNVGETLFKNYYSTESKIMQGETDVTVEDSNATAIEAATLQNAELFFDVFGWSTEVWEVVDGQYPTLIAGE